MRFLERAHSMKRNKIIICFLLSIILFISGFAEDIPGNSICFNWAFVYKNLEDEIQSLDFSKQVNYFESGTRLKIYLEPIQQAYIYLLLYDTNKDLFLLFPERENGLFSEYTQGASFYIPARTKWFYLKNTGGLEIFYLIVSATRCHKLEQVIEEYLLLKEKKSVSLSLLNNAKQVILDEIHAVKKENSIFKGLIEKPVIIAGDYRGENNILEHVYRIQAENFYAKTIRVAY